jgi:hypothetical protein
MRTHPIGRETIAAPVNSNVTLGVGLEAIGHETAVYTHSTLEARAKARGACLVRAPSKMSCCDRRPSSPDAALRLFRTCGEAARVRLLSRQRELWRFGGARGHSIGVIPAFLPPARTPLRAGFLSPVHNSETALPGDESDHIMACRFSLFPHCGMY